MSRAGQKQFCLSSSDFITFTLVSGAAASEGYGGPNGISQPDRTISKVERRRQRRSEPTSSCRLRRTSPYGGALPAPRTSKPHPAAHCPDQRSVPPAG